MCCERKLSNIFSLISVAAAPGLGVLLAVLFYQGLLPGIVTGVWVAVGIAALVLAASIILAAVSPFRYDRSGFLCRCCRIGSVLAAAAGVIFAGIATLVIGLTVGSLLSAILVGFGAFFFVFLIIQAVDLILCYTSQLCKD